MFQRRWEPARVCSPVQVDEARAALQMRFLVLAPRRIDALRAALLAAPGDEVARREMQRMGHQLHGTAATVGFGDLGLLGGVVERAAAASPYGDEPHARAASAVELIGEYLSRARSELAPISLADDPRFVTLLAVAR
ncbi:MAG: Hpt domain-containing protein [Myxococcales bacterium]|nr:Hpt domain-containing protein [Myxococcales bacterium]